MFTWGSHSPVVLYDPRVVWRGGKFDQAQRTWGASDMDADGFRSGPILRLAGGTARPATGDDVIAEECRMFVRRLRRRAAYLGPEDAANVCALADRLLLSLGGS